jgi:hypothetical protein
VSKRQPKVHRQRDQRQPRTLPDSVSKPAHFAAVASLALSRGAILSETPFSSI